MSAPKHVLVNSSQDFLRPFPPGVGSIHYPFLDGLRGAAAFYVMTYHLLAWVPSILPLWISRLQRPISFGHVAVSLFIVLSGFSLGLPVARANDKRLQGGVGGYLARRAKRILPAYFTATIIGILVAATLGHAQAGTTSAVDLSVGSLGTHLLLIHNLSQTYSHTINMAHWSVAAEWQIYFLFPLLLLPVWRAMGPMSMVAVGFAFAAILLAVLPPGHNLWWTCPWYVGLFATGAAASTFEQSKVTALTRFAMIASAALLLGLYVFVHMVFYNKNVERPAADFAKDSLAGMLFATLLVYFVASNNRPKLASNIIGILESKVLRWLGACSYSLYLIHCTILTICLFIASALHWSDVGSFSLRMFFGVPMSLATAYVMYRLCEKPFLRKSKVTPQLRSSAVV